MTEQDLTIEDEIVAALRRIVRGIDQHSSHLVYEVGLTWPQLATLRTVGRLGPCSISTLARTVHLGQPTLTGIVKRLERAAYVIRTPNEADRRSVRISATAAGRAILRRAPSLLQDRFRTELAKLKDWERLQTLASLKQIAEMMDVEALDASPLLVAGPVEPTAAGDPSGGDLGRRGTAPRASRRPRHETKTRSKRPTQKTEC
ncbi:MAG: MarR family transcriptional regulator [Phycisphaerae bacterium]|jgi:DNA-binding MarR family transcriptional regulator